MNLSSIIKEILNLQKKIDLRKLPSLGLFYKDDFEINIKKADIKDVIEYELNFEKENLGLVISKLKKVVEKNIILSPNYKFNDIKSVDIVFLFMEIVKFTNGKTIDISFFNDLTGQEEIIQFNSDTFN